MPEAAGKRGGAASRLRGKYAASSVEARAAVWFVACSFLQRGITLVTTPVFARLMPTGEYGVFNTFSAWESVATLVVTLTLYKSLMNLYVKRDDRNRVLSSVCTLSCISAVAWLVLSLLLAEQFSALLGMSKMLCAALFALLVGRAVIDCWTLHKRYEYDYKKVMAVTLALTLSSAAGGLLCVLLVEPTAESRAVPLAIATLAIGACLYVSIMRRGRCAYDKDAWLFALGFCIPLMPHYLSEFVLNSSDKLMINYLCGSSDVALYSVAYSVAGLIGTLTTAINSSYAPYTYQRMEAGEYGRLARTTNAVVLLVAAVLLLVELFGDEIVWVFGGSKYEASGALVVPLCMGMYFAFLFQTFARVQEYYVCRSAVVIPSVLCAVLNVALNYAFIGLYGYQAAAWTTFACYFVFCLLHYAFYRRLCRRRGIAVYDVKSMALISAGFIAASAAAFFVSEIIVVKYAALAVCLVVILAKRESVRKLYETIAGK